MSQGNCPTHEQLTGLLSAGLPDELDELVSSHLDGCSVCQETFVALADETTGASVPVGISRAAGSFEQEPECRQAVDLMKAIAHEYPHNAETLTNALAGDTHHNGFGDVPPIERLGVYQIIEPIGRGGMGIVYRAIHTRLRREVAIKVLPQQRVQDEVAVARFDREMRIIGQLEHPNIVSASDAGEENGIQYLVMELVSGMDLGALLDKLGPLPVAEACEIIRQAAEGLQHAHQRGLVHRDLKPSNLMLAMVSQSLAIMSQESALSETPKPPSVIVKILDLGLGLLTQESERGDLTSNEVVMGTIDYMAPEQIANSHGVDIRADIYSLGATLYKLLTGTAPFAGENHRGQLEKIAAIARDEVPPVSGARGDVPVELSQIVQRMLARDPGDRFDAPGEIALLLAPLAKHADLAALLGTTETTSDVTQTTAGDTHVNKVAPSTAASPSRQRSGAKIWIGGACLTLLCVLALLLPAMKIGPWSDAPSISDGDAVTTQVKIEPDGGEEKPGTPDRVRPSQRELAVILFKACDVVSVQTDSNSEPIRCTRVDELPSESFTIVGMLIRRIRELQPSDFELLTGNLTAVRSALFHSENVDDSALELLRGAVDLEMFDASYGNVITGPGLAMLRPARKLVDLKLGAWKLVDADLQDFQELTFLHLNDAFQIHGAFLKHMPKMEILRTYNSQITDASLAAVESMKNLSELCLEYDRAVTDDGLIHLQRLEKLTKLNLINCQQITDAGVNHLRNLKSLSHLELSGTQVTDHCVDVLSGLLNLKELDLRRTGLTMDGIAALRKALPDCKIRNDFDDNVP